MHETGGILDLTILTFALLFVAAAVAVVSRRLKFPLSVALVVIGVSLGVTARALEGGEGVLARVLEPLAHIQLTPEAVLFIFLPALIFESAYSLDVRRLFRNLAPILFLAVPGLLVSTAVIGLTMAWGLKIALPVALLFGVMISATDPVAVIAIFKELGAPKRLVTLVEGESLFNDATAIVVFSLILDLIAGGAAGPVGVIGHFLWVFLGGAAVGVALGWVFAWIVGKVENDRLVEITLTTVLAYLSFIAAEHVLHVSGVMSTVGAGLTLGSYGRTKISPPVAEFMHNFWSYLAWVANALIFLFVGLVLPEAVAPLAPSQLVWPVILAYVAAHVARFPVIFGLIPGIERLRWTDPVDRSYKTVAFWGGLRGAIALALGLSLLGHPSLDQALAQQLLALTAGVVLATLVINGVTMRPLVRALGLDRETRAESHLRAGSMLEVEEDVGRALEKLRAGALMLPKVLDSLVAFNEQRRQDQREALEHEALGREELLTVHRLQCLARETSSYLRMFADGNLDEQATRDLVADVEGLAAQLRRGRREGESATEWHDRGRLVARGLRAIPGMRRFSERLEVWRVAQVYEMTRGRFLAAREVLEELEHMEEAGAIDDTSREVLRRVYADQRDRAEASMDEMFEQFPEYVSKVQSLLGHRLMIGVERRGYHRLLHHGLITEEVHERLMTDLERRFHEVACQPVSALQLDSRSVLRSVPLFRGLSDDELDAVAKRLEVRSCVKGEVLFREGDTGDRMYLIGRGVVRVWRGVEDDPEPLAILTAGDFVGEMACLHPAPRTASAQTATVARLMELTRKNLDAVIDRFPAVGETLETTYRERRSELSLD